MSTERKGPLSRFKVIDLTRARAGPTAARHFADWGADVIKVEMPAGADLDPLGGSRDGPDFFNLHRNKRSITLNLKLPEGAAVLKKLAATADVLIENYRPDVKHRLGIDYETLRAINPRLVYVSLSGFGQDGPYANRPGFDQIAQGMGGLMSITGLPGQGPVRVGIPIADLSSGNYAAMGAFIALLEREVSGEGQWVQTSLLQAQISMLDFQAARWSVARQVPGQAGNDHPTSIPTGVFPTADGHINIAASGQHIFKRMCEVARCAEAAVGPGFCDGDKRSENRVRLNAEIGVLHQALQERRAGREAQCGRRARQGRSMRSTRCSPIRRSSTSAWPCRCRTPRATMPPSSTRRWCCRARHRTSTVLRPTLGEHTDEVLADLGYDSAAIGDLRRRKVI